MLSNKEIIQELLMKVIDDLYDTLKIQHSFGYTRPPSSNIEAEYKGVIVILSYDYYLSNINIQIFREIIEDE